MGRKKKKPVKPWCWYCNREFDDEKILIQHQRAKHFKCPLCHKKLYSGPGLTVHCVQVHKENLDKIPEALPNRNSVDIDIYGTQGVPEEDIREHERLKRGDTGESSSRSQDSNNSNNRAPKAQQPPAIQPHHLQQLNPAMNPMHAAMFQRAMSLGAMPPGFGPNQMLGMPPPMGMPPMMMPPGMMPPGYVPPPGFPQPMGRMLPTSAPIGFPPGMMLPQTSMAGHMGAFMPLQGGMPMPSTSGAVPPPPMSGVGHLLGVPPPGFAPPPPPSPPPEEEESEEPNREDDNKNERKADEQTSKQETAAENSDIKEEKVDQPSDTEGSQALDKSSKRNDEGETKSPKPMNPISAIKTVSSISKPPSTTSTSSLITPFESNSFIDIPGTKSRIMHPNSDLSLEEIRMGLSKYRDLIEKLPITTRTSTTGQTVG